MLGYTVVNIIFKNSPVQLGFTFKGYKAAEDCLKNMKLGSEGLQTVEDDFGCVAVVDMATIAGVVLNDIDREIVRGVNTRIEQDIVASRRMREESSKPANQIMMPAGKPVVANA